MLESAGKRNFSFIIQDADDLRSIKVNKILMEDANKIGGTKNALYSFKQIFDFFDHIDFEYVTTINVK